MNTIIRDTTLVSALPENPVLTHRDLVIRDDHIAEIRLHSESIPRDESDYRILNGSRWLILPGLVNSHAHTYMAYFRNYGGGLNLHDWLFTKIFPAEGRLTEADCAWGTAMGLLEMLRGGITSVCDMPLMPASAMDFVEQSGMRVATGHSVFQTEFNPLRCHNIFPQFEKAYTAYHNRGNGRMKVFATVHSGYLYPPENLAEGAEWLREKGYRVHTHLHETQKEVEDDLRLYGKTPIQRFAELGLLGPHHVAAHCIHLNEQDRALLSEYQMLVVPCPTSNLRLAAGFPPFAAMKASGMALALGTDGQSSGNGMNLWKEMHLASLLAAAQTNNPGALADWEVLQMVTSTPAKKIFAEKGERMGVLEVGAKADLIAISTDAPHFVSLNDPLAAAVHHTLPSDVVMAMVDGEILMEDARFTHLDEERIRYEVETRTLRLLDGLR